MTGPPRWSAWHYLVAGISLANLSFLRRWKEMLTYTASDEYYMKLPPSRAQEYAAIFNVLWLGLLFAGITYLVSRVPPGRFQKLASGCFLTLLVIPLNGLREVFADRFPFLRGQLITMIGERSTAMIVLTLAALLLAAFI